MLGHCLKPKLTAEEMSIHNFFFRILITSHQMPPLPANNEFSTLRIIKLTFIDYWIPPVSFDKGFHTINKTFRIHTTILIEIA